MKLASFHAWSCQRIKHQQLVDKQDTTRQHKYEYPQWHLSDINQSASVAKWSGQRTNFWPRMTPQTAWARFYELQISSSLFISFKQETTSTPTKLSDVTRIGNEVWASSTNWIFTPVIQRLMQTDKMTRIHKETQHRSLEKKPNLEQNSWLVENWKAKPIVQCRNSKYYTPENRGFTQTYKTKLNSLTGSRKTQTAQQIGWWRLELEAKLFPTRAATWSNLLPQSNDRRIKLQQKIVQNYKCFKLMKCRATNQPYYSLFFPPMESVVNQTTLWSNLEITRIPS